MSSTLHFSSTSLKEELIAILKEDDFTLMSDVQSKVIPLLLKGKNVLALSPTGTGKTLSFVLPIMNDIVDDGCVQAIIISPTVALLEQIKEVFVTFSSALKMRSDAIKAIYSNNDFNRAKPTVVLITPELYPLLVSHYPIHELKRVIIDEGDMVLFDGFENTFASLKKAKDRGIISFFSASIKVQDIKRIKSFFNISEVVDVRDSITVNTVSHHLVDIKNNSKADSLNIFLQQVKPYKSIAFCSKKDDLKDVSKRLKELGVKHLLVTGDMDKREISKVLDEFKKQDNYLLLASDYVSRGIDIRDVDTIISLDLPKDSSYYFHRAGRAGRFLTPGDSYIFYTFDDEESVKRVRDLQRRGTKFDSYNLNSTGIKKNKDPYQFKNKGKKDQSEKDQLQKKIRHAVNSTKSDKVKPGYKKKVKKAVELVKFKHRRKVVLTNISKNGGNVKDYHMDRDDKK